MLFLVNLFSLTLDRWALEMYCECIIECFFYRRYLAGVFLKKRVLYIFLIFLLGFSAAFTVSGQAVRVSRQDKFTILTRDVKVSALLTGAPAIGGAARSRRGGTNFADNWLQVNIQFQFQFPASLKGRTMTFLDRPSVELYMYNFRTVSRWGYGVQKLHSILLDSRYKSKKYQVSLFLPPNYVHVYMPRNKSDKLDPKALSGVVRILDEKGVVLGQKAFSLRGSLTKKESAFLLKQCETAARGRMSEYFFPREKTPWQWVDSDYYELPATELSGKGRFVNPGKGKE